MTNAHTPGPWDGGRLLPIGAQDFGINQVFSQGRNDGYDGTVIKAVAVAFGTSEESRANARLIAAAPDLFAALKFVLPLIEDGCLADDPEALKARAILRAVISKAEGSAR